MARGLSMRVNRLGLAGLGLASWTLLAACGGAGAVTSSGGPSGGSGGGAVSAGSGGAVSAGSGGAVSSSSAASGTGGGATIVDADGDGLDDGWEAMIAARYLPYVSVDPNDGCPLGGLLYRVHPHPANAAFLHIVYDHLYQEDCGLNGHIGDDEAFGITVDPSQPPPQGIVAMRGVGHQGTLCEQDTECGRCPGQTACDTAMVAGAAWPVVYASKDKHANYVLLSRCSLFTTCLDTCSLATTPAVLPMVNAGEPGGHLTEDLTTNGFITSANGWTEPSLLHFNPWDPAKIFGGAGNIAGDLVDSAFVPAACP
jgi:hypothetical protein